MQPAKHRFLATVISRGIGYTFYATGGLRGMARNPNTACYFDGIADHVIIIVCTMIYHALKEYISGSRKVLKFEGSDVNGK
jgi:Domain of unknown function (DUF6532)